MLLFILQVKRVIADGFKSMQNLLDDSTFCYEGLVSNNQVSANQCFTNKSFQQFEYA